MFFFDFQDCFIVDNGEAGIWVWTGKRASPMERRESMTNAMVVSFPFYFYLYGLFWGQKITIIDEVPSLSEVCLLTMSLGNEMCLELCLMCE